MASVISAALLISGAAPTAAFSVAFISDPKRVACAFRFESINVASDMAGSVASTTLLVLMRIVIASNPVTSMSSMQTQQVPATVSARIGFLFNFWNMCESARFQVHSLGCDAACTTSG